MSKKKSFSGSTMTLKDFHGGSIPSDLPLPSAPGVIVRPNDRPSYDRQSSPWGVSVGKTDQRLLRPNSSGSMRSFDDKTPFNTLSSVNMGRYFDEDERKPLDLGFGVRRVVNDDSFHGMVSYPSHHGEVKAQDVGRFSGPQSLGSSTPQLSGVSGGPWSAKVVEGTSSRVVGGNSLQGHGGSQPNAWGVRKDVVAPSGSVVHNTVSKFSQASALDKVASGRWQTKPMHHIADVEVIIQSEVQNDSNLKGSVNYDDVSLTHGRANYERDLVMRAERTLAVQDGGQRGPKELPGTESVQPPAYDTRVGSPVPRSSGGMPAVSDGKYGNVEAQPPAEASERQKLKLLPRTKPLDVAEPSLLDNKLVNVELHGTMIHAKSGPSNDEAENRFVERPRLNLKPRSQPIESAEKNRTLFGGARPRELVLKERGVDDVAMNEDLVQVSARVKNDVPSARAEILLIHANSSRHSEKIEDIPSEHRIVKGTERIDQRVNGERADTQRKNQRNENWRSGRDVEKQPHQQRQQERKPSPETWRRPVEPPKSAQTDGSGVRYGKAVSAVELATAFSRSVSEPKASDQFSGRRGLPGPAQIPFSRLTGPALQTRSHINGY